MSPCSEDAEDGKVLFTIPEFAFLVKRNKVAITQLLHDGKLAGVKRLGRWFIHERELVRYWGHLYGRQTNSKENQAE